jgi:hypothetical protein
MLIMVLIVNAKKLSLREVEQLFSKINLIILSTPTNIYLYPPLLVFLLIAKEYHCENYNKYMCKGNTPEELIQVLYSMAPEAVRVDKPECGLIEGYLIGAKSDGYINAVGSSLKFHKDTIEDDEVSAGLKRYSTRVLNISNNFDAYSNSFDLNSLKQRIELMENFNFGSQES